MESRVGTRLFYVSARGCESGKVYSSLGHKTVIFLITWHKTHSIIFSPWYYTGLETYDPLEVTVWNWRKGTDEGNVNGWAPLRGSSKKQPINLVIYIFQWKVNWSAFVIYH